MWKLLLPFLLLAGLIATTVLTDRPMPRADFTFINRGDVTTLDVSQMSWMQDIRACKICYEGLVRNDVFSREFRIAPAAAERWEISPDKLTYTFHLRPDAKWSNGQPLKASDFIFSWRRAILPDTAADYSGFMMFIKGGQAFFDWRSQALADFARHLAETGKSSDRERAEALWKETLERFDRMFMAKAVDDRTIVITLERPTPYFLDLCGFVTYFPVYEPLVKAYEFIDPETARVKYDQSWTKPPLAVFNGPFVVDVWRFKRDMHFTKNPHYWDRDNIEIDTISIPTVEDPNAAVMSFRTGAVDWVSDVVVPYRAEMLVDKQQFYREHQADYDALVAQGLDPIEVDRRLPRDPRKNIHAFPAFGTYFWNFNCLPKLADGRANPFHDPRVRRAFSMAVDKAAIADQVRRCGEPVAPSLIPAGSIAGYTPPKGVPFDPAAARKLLAEAGYPEGKGFINVELLFTKDGGHDLIAQAIAKNWQEYLGVSVTLALKEVKTFRDQVKNKGYITSRGSWYGDYGDPTTFLDLSKTGDGNNDRGYSNPKYDAMLERAATEPDPDKRLRILEEAERFLIDEECPVLPIFHYVQIYLFDANRITGISSHPRQEQQMFEVDVFNDGKGKDRPRFLPPRPPSESQNSRGIMSR
jgi:oligopeptide transport system substrate-binding protein